MRSKSGSSRCVLFALAGLAVGFSAPAFAWSGHHDHVYADSFGNLVIDSAAGYKRILVGEGAMAGRLAAYIASGQSRAYADEAMDRTDCYRPPVFVTGRSYMYGLSNGEMPELSPCR